jgi:hypothetical protein
MFPDTIELWHQRVRPNPTDADFRVQLGCHFEEIAEMLAVLRGSNEAAGGDLDLAHTAITLLAVSLKQGRYDVEVTDRKEFLDSVADQVVTGIGAAWCARMNATEALRRVNTSNWSKLDFEGKPIRDANGKITKGPDYKPPQLDGLF